MYPHGGSSFHQITLGVKLGFFLISTGVFCTQHISGIYITFVRRLAIFILREICTETSVTASVTYERRVEMPHASSRAGVGIRATPSLLSTA